jgi:hypothetical protein
MGVYKLLSFFIIMRNVMQLYGNKLAAPFRHNRYHSTFYIVAKIL